MFAGIETILACVSSLKEITDVLWLLQMNVAVNKRDKWRTILVGVLQLYNAEVIPPSSGEK